MDGWWLGGNIFTKTIMGFFSKNAALDVYDPDTMEERRRVAGTCQESLKYGIPTLVDEMDDAVNKAYAAWPTRLYLIDLNGKVVYHGGVGPFDFHPYKLENAIEEFLAKNY